MSNSNDHLRTHAHSLIAELPEEALEEAIEMLEDISEDFNRQISSSATIFADIPIHRISLKDKTDEHL